MDAIASISVIENDLRDLCSRQFVAKWGAEWLSDPEFSELRATLEQRRIEEAKRRAPAVVPETLLAYTHLYELLTLMRGHWDDFASIFGARKDFLVLMGFVEDFRNAPAHSRELLPYEGELLSGIAGLVRTRVIAYMSTLGPDSQYYPLIESMTDSLGTVSEPSMAGFEITRSALSLTVGTEVSVRVRAWDPKQRDLHWRFYTAELGSQNLQEASGAEAEFTYTVTDLDVGAHFYLKVEVASSGRFHRHGSYDDKRAFVYDVVPPDDA